MTGYEDIFQEKENRNWLKAVLAVHITKDGLSDFIQDVVTKLQLQILTDVLHDNGLPPGTTCNKCGTANVLPCKTPGICSQTRSCKLHNTAATQPRQCVTKICNDFQSRIKKHHRFDKPSWANTDSTKWCSQAWEVAKCYFPPDGYHDKQSGEDTDLNGVISPIINCTYFQNFIDENLDYQQQPTNIFTVAREVGRHLRHSVNLLVTDIDLADYFSVLKKALSDPKCLQNNENAKAAFQKITKLEVDQLVITTDDIVKVIQDTTRQSKQLMDNARELNQETKDLQCKLSDLKALENVVKQIVSTECKLAIADVHTEGQNIVKTVTDQSSFEVKRIQAAGDKIVQAINQETQGTCEDKRKREYEQKKKGTDKNLLAQVNMTDLRDARKTLPSYSLLSMADTPMSLLQTGNEEYITRSTTDSNEDKKPPGRPRKVTVLCPWHECSLDTMYESGTISKNPDNIWNHTVPHKELIAT